MAIGAHSQYLDELADGTVKQRHPISDNEVWTVPSRGNRPLGIIHPDPQPLDPARHGHHCAFCEGRYLDTPPEKSRLVREADQWRTLTHVQADDLFASTAEFRCIPNLFEILSYDYWHLNHGYELSPDIAERRATYLASPAGREHVLTVSRTKLRAAGRSADEVAATSDDEVLAGATGFFGGGHDVIVARRHFVEGASDTSQLASSGTLTIDEHRRYVEFTIAALRRLQNTIPQARHMVVFQNWLKPAGASFDHLHKQLVAIDEYDASNKRTLAKEIGETGFFNSQVLQTALDHHLVLASNEHAVAFAGFGHRYPTIKVVSTSPTCDPTEQTSDEVGAMSDLLHAIHAATGPDIACNEEWHQRPPKVGVRLPWYINVKWRISTLAGFEGGTKISLNTLSPGMLRDRLVPRLVELREQGLVAPMRVGDECRVPPWALRYHLGE